MFKPTLKALACALALGDVIDVDDLPTEIRGYRPLPATPHNVRPLYDVERDYIMEANQAVEYGIVDRVISSRDLPSPK